jgi:hypothetical protein
MYSLLAGSSFPPYVCPPLTIVSRSSEAKRSVFTGDLPDERLVTLAGLLLPLPDVRAHLHVQAAEASSPDHHTATPTCTLHTVSIVSMNRVSHFFQHRVHARGYVLLPARRAISCRAFCLDSIYVLCVLYLGGHRDAQIYSSLYPVLWVAAETQNCLTSGRPAEGQHIPVSPQAGHSNSRGRSANTHLRQ